MEERLNHFEYNNLLFKRLVPIYDLVAVSLRAIRNDIIKNINLKPGSKVIDLACGTGTQAIKLAQNGHVVTGIDISPDMVSRAKRKNKGANNPVFKIKNATKTSYPESSFDVSIISFALHDMPHSMRREVIKEAKRVTRPNGKIVIVDYSKHSNRVTRKLLYYLTKTWESRYYDNFLDKGLDYYLRQENMLSGVKKNLILYPRSYHNTYFPMF